MEILITGGAFLGALLGRSFKVLILVPAKCRPDRFTPDEGRFCRKSLTEFSRKNRPFDRKPRTRLRHGADFDGYFRGSAKFSRV